MVFLLLISLISSNLLVNYFVQNISREADVEALSHVRENTEQLHYSFVNRVNDAWTIMTIADNSLSSIKSDSPDEAVEYLDLMQKKTSAERVYLISSKGVYLDDTGDTGRWDMDQAMLPLLRDNERICRLHQVSSGGDLLDFAIPLSSPVTDKGYEFLLMEYKLDTFLEVLSLRSYGGKGVAYILDGSGRTLFKSSGSLPKAHEETYFFYRFLDGMSFECNDSVTDVESLREQISQKCAGAVYVENDTYSYALSFLPLEDTDWTLVLMVDRSAIAGGRMVYMQKIQWIAVGVNLLVMLVCLGMYTANTLWIRRRSEVQLSSRERIIDVLSTDSQGAYILTESEKRKCTFVSQNVESILGVPSSELVGQSAGKLLDIISEPDLNKALTEWKQDKILDFGRFLFVVNNTDQKYLRIRVFPTKNKELVFSILDETAEAKKEQELKDAVNAASSANQAKSVFLSNMSHDIRTPMNAIIGFTTLAIANENDPKKMNEYLSKILSSGNHLLSLINDVLDMSRIESGKLQLEETEINLSDILHNIKAIVSGHIHEKQLDLYIDTLDVTDEDVFCDKTRLNQVLLNLLSNAIKFTAPGGTVSVRISQLPDAPQDMGRYEIRVKDTGIGMSQDFAERIFEPFERERTSTVSRIQGTGLGMAITKKIIDTMGGTIEVITEQGKGTEFIIRLDLRLQSEQKHIAPIPALTGLKALVADDDLKSCGSVTRKLEKLGISCEYTMSGKDAVIRARQAAKTGNEFNAYIINWQLSDMNGIEAARQIRRETGVNKSAIILTAYDWTDIENEALEAGVTAFCSKPVCLSELRKSLLSMIGKNDPEHSDTLPSSDDIAEFRGKRILVTEDNELNRVIAVDLLKGFGFDTETAENGQIAVDMVKNSSPGYYDVILMDIKMPVMDGIEATKQIRALEDPRLADITILAMTANAFEEDRQTAIRAGMNGFVSKPIYIDQMLETLRNIFCVTE